MRNVGTTLYFPSSRMDLNDIFNQRIITNESSLKDLQRFQNEYNIKLPNSYIQFILEFNNSSLKNSKFLFTRSFKDGFKQSFYLEEVFSIDKTEEFYRLFFIAQPESEIQGANVIPIAKAEGRTYICIGIYETNFGQIFLWDGDFGVTKQAETLQDFFDSLVLDDAKV